ncbi:MAG: hypothetical protein ACFB9N_09860 [Geitlerinemataceae cyanobacterium]
MKSLLLLTLDRARRRSPTSGITLIEGLVAILITSAVTVAITPPIFLSAATRVQNRRAEQATQLANGQIDQVRVLMEQGVQSGNAGEGGNLDQLPENAGNGGLESVPAPSSVFGLMQSTNFSCSTYDDGGAPQVPAAQALPVDINGDCELDFYVQSFRVNEQLSTVDAASGEEPVPIVFGMGVRVYYRNAEIEGGELSIEPASLTLTNGTGQQTKFPLAVMYTSLAQGDLETSLPLYRCYLGGSECE